MSEQINKTTNSNQKSQKRFLKTIRTYQGDVASILQNKKTSLTKIVFAEKKKKIANKSKTDKKNFVVTQKRLITIIAIITGLLGTGGIYLWYNPVANTRTAKVIKIPALIFPDYREEIFSVKLKRSRISKTLEEYTKEMSIPLGSIIQLYVTKKDPTKNFVVEKTEGNKVIITTDNFFDLLETSASDSFIRALGNKFMFGYHSSLGDNPFLIFRVVSYESAFAGMLKWEKTITEDLSPIFKSKKLANSPFKDIVVNNRDTRAILNNQGKIEFAYSFPDKRTLIIVNNKTTLKEIFRRLISANMERHS